jgi:hypothetical protein
MKTVEMFSDFDYAAHPRRTVRFKAGIIYARVLDAAASAIERAGAGRIERDDLGAADQTIDASHAFRPRWRR